MLTIDPATLLPTGEVVENGLSTDALPRLTGIEVAEPDYNKFDALADAAKPAASLSEATRGRLDDSLRHRELRRPSGFEDELRAVLVNDAVVLDNTYWVRFERSGITLGARDLGAIARLVLPS